MLEKTEQNHDKSQFSRFLDKDMIPGSAEYKAVVLTLYCIMQ